jgi:hypothetical protein
MWNFIKIYPVGAELLHSDRRTDRRDDVDSRFSNSANAPKNEDTVFHSTCCLTFLKSCFNVLEFHYMKCLISCNCSYWLCRNGKCSLFWNVLSFHWPASIVFSAWVSGLSITTMEYSLPIMLGAYHLQQI